METKPVNCSPIDSASVSIPWFFLSFPWLPLMTGRYSKPIPIQSTSQQQQKSNSNTEQNKDIVHGKHQINARCAIKILSKDLIAACVSSVCDSQEETASWPWC